MLSERTQEIQALRKQLADKQLQLTTAERQSSSTAQETYLETAELRTLLAEKDSLIDVRIQWATPVTLLWHEIQPPIDSSISPFVTANDTMTYPYKVYLLSLSMCRNFCSGVRIGTSSWHSWVRRQNTIMCWSSNKPSRLCKRSWTREKVRPCDLLNPGYLKLELVVVSLILLFLYWTRAVTKKQCG